MQDAEFYATCGLCVPIVIGLREIKAESHKQLLQSKSATQRKSHSGTGAGYKNKKPHASKASILYSNFYILYSIFYIL